MQQFLLFRVSLWRAHDTKIKVEPQTILTLYLLP